MVATSAGVCAANDCTSNPMLLAQNMPPCNTFWVVKMPNIWQSAELAGTGAARLKPRLADAKSACEKILMKILRLTEFDEPTMRLLLARHSI